MFFYSADGTNVYGASGGKFAGIESVLKVVKSCS